MTDQSLKIYFAGDLFDAKDLCGNLLLAESIEKYSGSRYTVMLPQDGECEVTARISRNIRDRDFELLYDCDIIVANFDGCDPDSGTVVEFCFAKMVDMPALLLRTDFRDAGDHTLSDGEPWNLMCSHYPRTAVQHINSMALYHRCKQQSTGTGHLLEEFYKTLAMDIISSLDRIIAEPSWLEPSQVFTQYLMSVKSIGGTLPEILTHEKLQEITTRKINAGIY